MSVRWTKSTGVCSVPHPRRCVRTPSVYGRSMSFRSTAVPSTVRCCLNT
ncbi:MAG: hypothetical protein ACK55Z_37980 [bacterium]